MSQQDLWAVMGRLKTDATFAAQLFQDFDGTLQANGYTLTPLEVGLIKTGHAATEFAQNVMPNPPVQEIQETFKLQQDEMRRRMVAQNDRMIDLNQFTADILKQTISHSASTYRKVTMMNQVMFWMGVGLFGVAVVTATVFRNLDYSTFFAGLGSASFVAFFFLGPIQKTQVALSNLIQAEIAFMNYFEQLALVESYASMPRGDSPNLLDPARLERASEMLQQRSQETVDLLQRYLEDTPTRSTNDAAQKRDDAAAKAQAAGASTA